MKNRNFLKDFYQQKTKRARALHTNSNLQKKEK